MARILRRVGRGIVLWLKIAVLGIAGPMPALRFEPVTAAQLSSRKVTISTSKTSATDVEHVFSFSIPNTSATKAGIIYDFCTTPLGTCTLPTGMSVESATHDSQSAWPNNATAFALVAADTGDCTITSNTYRVCYSRDETVATGTTGGAVTHTISNITAPSSAQTVYVRISIYSDDDFGSGDLLDQGVVAEAFVNQLTVTGRVAERLQFCVGAIADGDGSTDDTPTSCTSGFPTATEVAIGVIDDQDIYVTPVEATSSNLANDSYGIAMVNTNASGGIIVQYYAEPASNVTGGDTDQLRSFRVLPTDCSATAGSLTDQCFRTPTTNNTSETFTQGQERFGMYIPCIDSHHDSVTTINLTASTEYDGTDGDATEASEAAAGTCQYDEAPTNVDFAYNSSATPFTIASSSTVVDSEAIKLAFGATASPTTPEGSYQVTLTYIATPTF